MKVWLHTEQTNGASELAFDPPEDPAMWVELATREVHYEAIALMLEKMARTAKNPARRQVAWDLAKQLRRHVPVNNFCH